MSVRDVVQAAAGALGGEATYVEDVFSTYLYSGDATTRDIVNGIDLAGEGGLVWIKTRNAANQHFLFDTERGVQKYLSSNNTDAEGTLTNALSAFNSDGFQVQIGLNNTGDNQASWTFRNSPKFFSVVTYTGNSTPRTIAHNLGSVPGCMIVKRLDTTASDWNVYHRSLGNSKRLLLNSTAQAYDVGNVCWNSTTPTDSVFSLGTNSGVNTNGSAYVAYLFAHDAGGFGDDGTENVISCGSFTKSSGVVYSETLGWEPQWLLFKRTDAAENWFMIDNMRSMTVGGTDAYLIPNLSNAEGNLDFVTPTATGFEATNNFNNGTYIYIAIRRGPMKTPTVGTEVYNAVTLTGNGTARTITGVGFPSDLVISKGVSATTSAAWVDRLRGAKLDLAVSSAAELSDPDGLTGLDSMDGFYLGTDGNGYFNYSGFTYVDWCMRRAPSFFDVVAYAGTSTASNSGQTQIINHNLGVAPEFIIVKRRNSSGDWAIWHTGFNSALSHIFFDGSAESTSFPTFYFSTSGPQPTASQFTVGDAYYTNSSGSSYIAYLFATLPGVSKVGSYTGTAADLNVDCGFSAGARFVLIKRTDSTGGWYVWDSARGITAGNDPYVLMNSTAAEVTGTDYIDPLASGFTVTSSAPAALNASGGNYIFLAIA